RHAVIEEQQIRGVRKSWRRIAEGTLSRVDFRTLNREELALKFSESRQPQFRMVIDNRDSPPLEVAGIKAEGDVYELDFLAGPGRRYQLIYGSVDADAATYDTAAIEELLRKGFQPARAELGPQQPAPGAGRPSAFKLSKILNNPLLLGGVIALLVIVLGWGLYSAVRR